MKTKVLFDFAKKKKLEEYPIIKCQAGEKILCVQRKHPIVLVVPLVFPIIMFFFFLFSLVFLAPLLPQISSILTPHLTLYTIVTMLCALLLIETFLFMDWYYQFYVITNKVILYRHCFRISGFYSEEVFFDKMHQREIRRDSQNILYDFLKIQDVYVYFNKLEQEEPFLFKTPENAQQIEDLLDNLTI